MPEQALRSTVTALSDAVRFEPTLHVAFKVNAKRVAPGQLQVVAELDGECHRHTPPAITVRVEMQRTEDGPAVLVEAFRDLGRKPFTTGWIPLSNDFHNLVVSVTRASSARKDDGTVELRLDGARMAQITGLDLYWRHHPNFYTLDTEIVETATAACGPTVPSGFVGPPFHRRHVRRRRR